MPLQTETLAVITELQRPSSNVRRQDLLMQYAHDVAVAHRAVYPADDETVVTIAWLVAGGVPFVATDYRHGKFEESAVSRGLTLSPDRTRAAPIIKLRSGVRRLTPVECERLQGFPDGWTDVPFKGKKASDSARYRALGNSMAVNCMRWIGTRIASM